MEYYSLEDGDFYTGWKIIDGKNYYFTNGRNTTFNKHEDIDGKNIISMKTDQLTKQGSKK